MMINYGYKTRYENWDLFALQQIKIAVGEEVVTRRARLQPREKREATEDDVLDLLTTTER